MPTALVATVPPRELIRANGILDFCSAALPKRIVKEDVGDAREALAILSKANAPPWKVYAALTSWLIFLAANACREISASVQGKDRKEAK